MCLLLYKFVPINIIGHITRQDSIIKKEMILSGLWLPMIKYAKAIVCRIKILKKNNDITNNLLLLFLSLS